jgi:hypothetical protein
MNNEINELRQYPPIREETSIALTILLLLLAVIVWCAVDLIAEGRQPWHNQIIKKLFNTEQK